MQKVARRAKAKDNLKSSRQVLDQVPVEGSDPRALQAFEDRLSDSLPPAPLKVLVQVDIDAGQTVEMPHFFYKQCLSNWESCPPSRKDLLLKVMGCVAVDESSLASDTEAESKLKAVDEHKRALNMLFALQTSTRAYNNLGEQPAARAAHADAYTKVRVLQNDFDAVSTNMPKAIGDTP